MNTYHCSLQMFGYGEKRTSKGVERRPKVDQVKRLARANTITAMWKPSVAKTVRVKVVDEILAMVEV